jgi:hypothetical protein
MRDCPHGDPTCPCQDGDPCNYEDDPETGTVGLPSPLCTCDVGPRASYLHVADCPLRESSPEGDACADCRGLGWVLDSSRPRRPGPAMPELIPCVRPDCGMSGRPLANICFKGVRFHHVSQHPTEGWVMSLSDAEYEDWVSRTTADARKRDADLLGLEGIHSGWPGTD